MAWSGWVEVGALLGGFKGPPSVVSRSPRYVNVYARSADDALVVLRWSEDTWWGSWPVIGASREFVLDSSPAAGTMGPDHEHVFVRGTDGQVWQIAWTAQGGWGDWVCLGAPPTRLRGAPTVCSRSRTLANVYVVDEDGVLWQRAWDGQRWRDWVADDSDVRVLSDPSACATGEDSEHVFACVNGDVGLGLAYRTWTADRGWWRWRIIGHPPDQGGHYFFEPSAVSRGAGFLNVYVAGSERDPVLYQLPFNGRYWSSWVRHDSPARRTGRVAAGSMGAGHEHVFCFHGPRVFQKSWVED